MERPPWERPIDRGLCIDKQILQLREAFPQCRAIYDGQESIFFRLDGQDNTPFAGGQYLGLYELAKDWPFGPPEIIVYTPNGRVPSQTVVGYAAGIEDRKNHSPATQLLQSMVCLNQFFVEGGTEATLESTDDELRALARDSIAWNREHFPDIIKAFDV